MSAPPPAKACSTPIRIACERCHAQKLRCPRDDSNHGPCTRCQKAGAVCIFSPSLRGRSTPSTGQNPTKENPPKRQKKPIPAKPPASRGEDMAYLVSPPRTSNEPRPENMNTTDVTGYFLEATEWSTNLPEQHISNPCHSKCTTRQDFWNGHTFDNHDLITELSTGFHEYDTEMNFSDFQILTPDSAIPGRLPKAVIGDSPSSTSYNQSTVSDYQNDVDQTQDAVLPSPESPITATKDKPQNASQDAADDTEDCIRALSELSLSLNQCRRLFSLSKTPDCTQSLSSDAKSTRANNSQNAKNRLPAIPIDRIFRCSQRMVDLIQNAKKNIVKNSSSNLYGSLNLHAQAQSNTPLGPSHRSTESTQKRNSEDISMSRGPYDSSSTLRTRRNFKSAAPDKAAADSQSYPPSRAPRKQEKGQWQNNYYDERGFKSPDTSILLLFLSCHEGLLNIYSMVCSDVQKSLSGTTTPQSEGADSRGPSEQHQSKPTIETGTITPSDWKVRGDQYPAPTTFDPSPRLLNLSSLNSSPSATPEITTSRMELSLLLSMFAWFIDEIDDIFPEISIPDPDLDPLNSAAMEENNENDAPGEEETLQLGKNLINHWVRTRNRACKEDIKSVNRILKNCR